MTPPNWRNADQWIVTCLACHGELAVLPAQDVGGLCKHCACPRSLHPHRQCAVIQIAAEDWT